MPEPTLFPILPDGGAALRETIAFDTDVLKSYAGAEQRLARRRYPALGLGFGATARDVRANQLTRNLLLADPEPGFLVPWWPYAARLSSPVAPDDTTVAADLSAVPRVAALAGARYLLYASPLECELLEVADITETGLTLSSPAIAPWPTRSILLPLLPAHLAEPPQWERFTEELAPCAVRFAAELVSEYSISSGPRFCLPDPYLGLDVFQLPAAGAWDGSDALGRRTAAIAADAGATFYDSQDSAGGLDRTVALRMTASAALALRRFFLARAGRLNPFWLDPADCDLKLAAAAGSGSGLLTVYESGYLQLLGSGGNSRRHLAVRCPSGAVAYLEVGSPGDSDGGVATLELISSGPPEDLPAGTGISILRYCRLGDDVLELAWQGQAYAEARLSIVELPTETPTGVLA